MWIQGGTGMYLSVQFIIFNSVADPGFSRRGRQLQRCALKVIIWPISPWKLHENRRNWTEKWGVFLAPPSPAWIRQYNYMHFFGNEGQNNRLAPMTFAISAPSGKSWIRHCYKSNCNHEPTTAHFLSSCEHIKQLVENTLVPDFSRSTLNAK